ncbi:MAG: DNRLRE domain-containing protein [Planctomycetota bacterium]|jgi:hypothetical protein
MSMVKSRMLAVVAAVLLGVGGCDGESLFVPVTEDPGTPDGGTGGGGGGGSGGDGIGDGPTGPVVPSELADWAEGTMDEDDGATRDYYNRIVKLAWKNELGDWADRDDVEQGANPYATASAPDDGDEGVVEWDVTELVQRWVSGDFPNRGFYIKGRSGSFRFHSRESADAAKHAKLVVDGVEQPLLADTFLSQSTFQGFGDDVKLIVSDDNPTLLRFDLSGIAGGTTILEAKLTLVSFEEHGDFEADIHRCSQSHEEPDDGPLYGVSQGYPADADIEDHSDVYMVARFEDANWGAKWTDNADYASIEPIAVDDTNNFVALQGKALRVMIYGGDSLGCDLRWDFEDETGSEPEQAYFRYYLRFSQSWQPEEGGKLPGFAGTYGVAGWGGRQSNGDDGWSARGLYRIGAPVGNPLHDLIPIGNYVYYADMDGIYGEHEVWSRGYRGYLERDRWYCIEQYVKLNNGTEFDGILRGWVDGQLAYQWEGLRFRHVNTLKIQRVWMNFWHGGTAKAPQDMAAFIDNVVISKSYIGPIYPAE